MQCRKCTKNFPDDYIFCPYCGQRFVQEEKRTKRANGTGSVFKQGDKYKAVASRYDLDGKHTKTKICKTKKEAYAFLASVTWSQLDIKKPCTFAELYQEWSAMHYANISHSKATDYTAAYKACEKLYRMRWADIGLRHFQQVVNEAAESYYTRKNIKTILNSMSKYAIECGYSTTNYAEHIKLPPKTKPHKEAFTLDEVQLLWDDYNAGNRFTGNILCMIYTGMRYGELTTVKPENIHLDKGYLLGGIKTEAGRSGEIILVDAIKPVIKDMLIDGGLPRISDTAFRKHFNEALKRAGCEEHTIHECRHTTATVLARAGIQPAIITEIMRHTSYEMTLEYTHISREDKLAAVNSALILPASKTP